MRKILCLSTLFVLLALMVQAVHASDWDIYVRGKLMTDTKISENRFYVPVKPFLDAMKFSYIQDDRGILHVSREPGYKRSINFSGANAGFEFNNNTFNVPLKHFDNKPYVDLEILASKMGLELTKTPQTGIIDVVDKVAQVKHQQAIAKMEAYEKRLKAEPTDDPGQGGSADYDPTQPVKQVGDIEGFLDESQWEARWRATIKNYADKPVNNVRVILHIIDGNGQDLDKQVKVVGTMNPGDQASADFYWQSTTHIRANPKIEIQHDPLPETQKQKLIETRKNDRPAEEGK